MPFVDGKLLSQNTLEHTISITSRWGIRSNGRVLYVARVRSFTVRMYRSMSPTC
jgi:hypothetical protein